MKHIFQFLAKAKAQVAVIIVLLIIQAYCDLALPTYTSDLLNVGLQQNGIEDAVPETIREESLNTLELFLDDAQTKTLEAAYGTADADGVRALGGLTEDGREQLNDLLRLPESVAFQLENSEEGRESLQQMKDAIAAGVMTKEDLKKQMGDRISEMDASAELMMDQVAVAYVSAEYEAQEKDLNEIRNAYLFRVGAKMLLMALGMAAVAILTGYIA